MNYFNKKIGTILLTVVFIVLFLIILGISSFVFAYKSNLSLQKILEDSGAIKKDSSISILLFGDAMFDRGVRKTMDRGKDPFEFMKNLDDKFVKNYDFKTLNLEGPITISEIGQTKDYNFKFDPKIATLLNENKFNIVNLANNHAFDYYSIGFDDTKKYLTKNDIDYFGGFKIEDSYKIKKVGDNKIAFVGIDESTTPINIISFYPLINKLKAENDFVVVNIHWGLEYEKLPSKIQNNIAHNLIDNGADVIYGHHPHVIQPIELYKNGVIFYSLGNFIFDQQDTDTRKGIGIGTILEKEKKTFYIFPFDIIGNQPKFFDNIKTAEFCNNFLLNVKNKNICKFEITNK